MAGISILGGEPLHPRNILATAQLAQWFKRDFPDKNIWLWTGYTFEDIMYNHKIINHDFELIKVLTFTDVLIEGPFINELKDLKLLYRGSSNQRVIDLQKTLQNDEIILFENNK